MFGKIRLNTCPSTRQFGLTSFVTKNVSLALCLRNYTQSMELKLGRHFKLLASGSMTTLQKKIKLSVYLLKERQCPWHVLQEQPPLHNNDFALLNGEEQSNQCLQCLATHRHPKLSLQCLDSSPNMNRKSHKHIIR